MVEVFRTNVQTSSQGNQLLRELAVLLPHCKINFDLGDCDRILRIEGDGIIPLRIQQLLTGLGFQCELLEE